LARFNSGGASGGGVTPTTHTLERLDNHDAAGVEATYTFTPATPLDDETYSSIMIVVSGEVTAALALEMKINGLAALYSMQKFTVIAGTVTGIAQVSTPEFEIVSAALLNIPTRKFSVIAYLMMGSPAFANPRITGMFAAKADLGYTAGTLRNTTNGEDEITSITWQTSVSTWIAGTTIDTYGIRRVV